MKYLLAGILMVSLSVMAQDPTAYLNNFDNKVYSLKTKGVSDFVVDIESPRLTKQINDQMIYGKVEKLFFRIFWTANPERFAIDVVGMPEGFKEVKEELKLSILGQLDNLIPVATLKRFAGYQFTAGTRPKEFIAKDSSGIASIPSYILKFDNNDKLFEIEGQKPVGTLVMKPEYEKESFSDGKWVLKSLVTTVSEAGQSITTKKVLAYTTTQGIGVLDEVELSTEQKALSGESKPLIFKEALEFHHYKINTGDALKYFLGDQAKTAP